jgi:hypothetical protein
MSRLDGFRAPHETAAQERGWHVVAAAYARRQPVHRRRVPLRPLLALGTVAALAAVAFTPPGHAVLTSVRKAIGIEHAQGALSSLPAPGRILAGGWIVNADGTARRLGAYADSSWSPFGRFVVTATGDRIVALTDAGGVRWQLGRPVTSLPRWGGTRTDTRIAYFSGQQLRIVAGDGTGDRPVSRHLVPRIAPAWRPGPSFALAYAETHGRVRVLDVERRRLVFAAGGLAAPRKLEWSSDGRRLLVVTRSGLVVFDERGDRVARRTGRFVDAAFLPTSHRVVTLTRHVLSLDGRMLFRTSGDLGQVVPSPNGRRLLVTWPEADQWLFVPARGGRVRAVGNIAAQLGGSGFPVDGWTS